MARFRVMETNGIIQNESFGSTCQYRYKTADFIGRGQFGNVYEATVRTRGNYTGGRFPVVKVFSLAKDKKPLTSLEHWAKWTDRIKMLLRLKHKNLVVYYKITVIKALGGACIELLMEYCRGRDLASLLQRLVDNETLLDQREAVRYAIDIAEGLSYLHMNNIIHGDLKPGNVFVKPVTDTEERLVIGDLDDFVLMQEHQTCVDDISHLRGTLRYMSPEMLKKFVTPSEEQELPGRKTDVWSFGCVTLSLANRIIGRNENWLQKDVTKIEAEIGDKFSDNNYISKIIDGYGPFVDDSIPAELSACIRRCLCTRSTDRSSAQDAVSELHVILNTTPTSTLQSSADEISEDGNSADTIINRLLNAEKSIQMKYGARRDETFGCTCQYEFRATDFLVEGNYGVIYMAKVTVRGNFLGRDMVAVKVDHCYPAGPRFEDFLRWGRQLRWWKKLVGLRHNQIAEYYKISVLVSAYHQEQAMIEVMMEYYEGKDLGTHLREVKENGTSLPERVAFRYAMELAEGIKFLHESYVMHGDLKPGSVLVRRMGSSQNRLVIGNLDTATQMQQSMPCSDPMIRYRGTVEYMSPETLKLYLREESMRGRETDIWSLGCIIVTLANAVFSSQQWIQKGDESFKGHMSDLRFAERILNGFIPVIDNSITASILDFLVPVSRHCLSFTASERISAADLARELRKFGIALLD